MLWFKKQNERKNSNTFETVPNPYNVKAGPSLSSVSLSARCPCLPLSRGILWIERVVQLALQGSNRQTQETISLSSKALLASLVQRRLFRGIPGAGREVPGLEPLM